MLRYARWAAVSTAEQAKKISIDVQLEKGAETAKKYGWVETHPPFVVPGESRTKIISLNMAEKEIPALREMLDAASRKEFDVLYVYDLNRFRTLMAQVFDSLCDYGVQIYIGAYPRDPVPPNEYTDEVKSAVGMIVRMADIISRSEINTLQKHYKEKMPKRISEYGLHAGTGKPPMGYKKPDRGEVLIVDPAWSRLVLRMRDMFLAGIPSSTIAETFNREGIQTRTRGIWTQRTVKKILTNPFYCGIVTWGKTKSIRDRRKDKHVLVEREPLFSNTGKHAPLWDYETYQRLVREFELRGKPNTGIKTRTLSRLLYCPCGEVLWACTGYKTSHAWRCGSHLRGHIWINDKAALIMVARQLVLDIQKMDGLQLPQPEDKRPAILEEMRDFTARKSRWMDAFETGGLDVKGYTERITVINERLEALQRELDEYEIKRIDSNVRQSQFERFANAINSIPNHILNDDPLEVNTELRGFISRIIVSQDEKSVTIEYLG